MKYDLETNRNAAARLRDTERELAASPIPPVDLRAVPRSEWERHLDRHLTLPPGLDDRLREMSMRPVQGERGDYARTIFAHEVAELEAIVESYHGIAAPFTVTASPTVQRTGRAWMYEPGAASSLTGFFLDRIEP